MLDKIFNIFAKEFKKRIAILELMMYNVIKGTSGNPFFLINGIGKDIY